MRGLFVILVLLFVYSFGFTQPFDNLIVAPEVLINGQTPSGFSFKPGRILDENTIWFCGVNGTTRETYVFRSINGGVTFTHNATPISGRAAQMDAFDANIAIVATAEGKIHRTTDGGANWTEVYSYMISVIAPGWFDACRVLNENVAVAVGDMEPDGNMHFVRTENKGETWTEITGIDFLTSAYAYYTWGSAACTIDDNIWVAATNTTYNASFVFRSFDAGVTWESFQIPNEVIATYPRSISFADINNGLIADRFGALFKSTDGGATWEAAINPPVADTWVNGLAALPGFNTLLGLDDMGVFYTPDLGETWGEINTEADTVSGYYIGGLFLNEKFGYVFSNNSVLRFEHQFNSTLFYGDTPVLLNNPYGWGYITGTNSYGDIGKYQRFDLNESDIIQGFKVYFAKMSIVDNPDTLYMVVKTVAENGAPDATLASVWTTADKVLTGTPGNSFSLTSPLQVDGPVFIGLEWAQATASSDTFALYSDADGEGEDANRAWEKFSDNNYNDFQTVLNPDYSWNIDVDLWIAVYYDKGEASSVEDMPTGQTPRAYALSQNYPNPFNPATRFLLQMPEQSEVTVTVYDLLGQRVEELFKGQLPAGSHEFNFDGHSYTSGVYFYRVETGSFTDIKKMILVK